MSLLLLDTTVLIDVERSDISLEEIVEDDDDVAISAITVAELLVGIEMASGRRRASREAFTAAVIESLPAISYGSAVAREHAVLLAWMRRSGRPRGAHDLIIAATARATGRQLVTADQAGFIDLPGVNLRPLGSSDV